MTPSPDPLPTIAEEDWRYVDCRPLTAEASAMSSPIPGESAGVGDFPAPTDVTHRWALGGTLRRLRLAGAVDLGLDDLGGTWALRLDCAPGAQIRVRVARRAAAGRSASWLHAALGRGASLVIEDAGEAGIQLAALSACVAQDAAAALRVIQHGGQLQRHRLDLSLDGTGASGTLAVAADPHGEHQAHVLTRVVHASGTTTSRQLIKAVLRDRARTSFDGVVTMLQGADGSTATQRNNNLVLSPQARADTRPQLDIRADEVEASHGATVGELDAEELLYLRARGLAPATARELLTTAFLAEALEAA